MQAFKDKQQLIQAFAHRWGVKELWLFGSQASAQAGHDSDTDILVHFLPNSKASLWDWPEMTEELTGIFNSRIDLLSGGVLNNPFRRRSILNNRELLYAA